MRLHPDLRALRDDDAPQRHAQDAAFAAIAAWRARPEVARVMADLDAFASVRPMAECAALSALFDDEGACADAFAARFVADMVEVLLRQPLAHVPLRHFTDGTISTLLLGRSGGVSLLLCAVDGTRLAAGSPPTTATFSGAETWERVLTGSGTAELVALAERPNGARFDRRSIRLAPGKVIGREGGRQAMLLHSVHGMLVTLKLQRRRSDAGAAQARPTREYDLATGVLVHQSAGSLRESRQHVAMALLGRMGRAEAVPLLAAMAGEADRPEGLRWEALRECLALDTAAGFAALTALARSPDDPLAMPAGALRAQLVERHPELAVRLEGIAPCLRS